MIKPAAGKWYMIMFGRQHPERKYQFTKLISIVLATFQELLTGESNNIQLGITFMTNNFPRAPKLGAK